MPLWMLLLSAYLVGSVPWAYLVTRSVADNDIRLLGDGNTGAKNTFDNVGPLPGLAVGILDAGKGALVITLARQLGVSDEQVLLSGALVVLGHDFPLYLRFRGGQGLASSVGIFAVLFPIQTLFGGLAIATSLALSRHWEGSLATGFVVMLVLLVRSEPVGYPLYALTLLLGVAVRKLMQRRQLPRPAA